MIILRPNLPAGLTSSQISSQLQSAISALQLVTEETIYAVAATSEGQPLTTDFGIPTSHTSYTAVSSGLPGLAPTVVSQICTVDTTSMKSNTTSI